MGLVFGSATRVLLDSSELTPFLNEADWGGDTDMEDVTPFGASGNAKVYTPAIASTSIDLKGFYDPTNTPGVLDPELAGDYGSAAFALTIGNQGFAVGSLVSTFGALEASFKITSPAAKVDKLAVKLTGTGPVNVRGFSLHDLVAVTTTGNGTSLDNTAGTANGGVATIHVTAASGTTPSLVPLVQHSVDNTTWVTLATFNTFTAAGSQRLIVPAGTTVNRYLRASWTVTGTTPSFTTQISFARM